MKRLRVILLILSQFILLIFSSQATYALDKSLKGRYSNTQIYFYNPEANCIESSSASLGTYGGATGSGLSSLQEEFVDKYHDIAEKLSIAYGIPWETVMAQGILESASGTSTYAVQRNNFFGIGAFDSNPDNAYSYSTPEEGWEGYYKNIQSTPTYRNHGVFQGDTVTDPYAYAQAIKNAGYATDPNYVSKLSSLISSIEAMSKTRGWASSEELAKKHPEMLENAAKNAAGGGGDSSVSDYASSSNYCEEESSEGGNGDINKTALELSWPERGHDPWNDPKPAYRTALATTGVNQLGDSCSMNGNSCDAFVATVLRYSGADPNVPCCGAAAMMNYFLSHPNLYKEIPNTGSTAEIRPGDIRSKSGHVEIIVQDTDGSYKIASASHCDRTADHAIPFYADTSYHIFRYIGGN